MNRSDAKSPLPGANLCGWGFLQINQESVPHSGVDYNINHGSPADDYRAPVITPWDGVVVAAASQLLYSWGRLLVIRHILPYDVLSAGRLFKKGQVVYTRYGHLAEFKVMRGQVVQASEQVGTCGGSNGTMKGTWYGDRTDPGGQWTPHLHFDIYAPAGRKGGEPWNGPNNLDAVQDWPSVRRYGYPPVGDKTMTRVVAARYIDPFAAIPASRLPGAYVTPRVF